MLKKEFKRKDVNRARNLIMGKTNASTGTQIGYNTKQTDHKEGDVWTEGRKTWTIKNGIKQTVSKLDKLKKEVFMPLSCPCCNKIMKHRLDKPNYKIHKKCWECVLKMESKMQHGDGEEYKKYIKQLKLKNKLSILEQTENYLLDVVNTSNSGYVSEDGVIEKWVGGINKKEFTKEIKKHSKRTKEKFIKELNDTERA